MRKLLLFMIVALALGQNLAGANPIHTPSHQHSSNQDLIHRSSHEVDEAWEAFHKAALGGTLASPAVQVEIELSLNRARELLLKAHDALDRGDDSEVVALTNEISKITQKIKRESQRKKR